MSPQPNTSVPVSNSMLSSLLVTDSTTTKQDVNFIKGNQQQEEWGDEDGEFELEEDVIHPDVSSPIKQRNNVVQEIKSPEHADANEHLMSNMPNNTAIDNNCLFKSSDASANTDKETDSNPQNNTINLSSPVTPDKNHNENPFVSSESDDLQKTKHGRKVHKPVLFTPDVKKSVNKNTINKRQRNINASSQASVTATNGDQDIEQAVTDDIVCTICRNGRSPKHNRIVLCDICDIPYHQQCHKPSIKDRVVEISDAEWICAKCEEAQRVRKRRKVDGSSTSASVSSDIFPGSPGNGLMEEQKVAYLSSLPQRVLIDLILIAEKLHPDLPLYPADVKEKIANNVYTATSNRNPSMVPLDPQVPVSTPVSQDVTADPSRVHLPAVGIDLPSYEEMIVQALTAIADPAGSAPRNIFEWMNNTYPLHKNFRASASQALQKAVKKERVFRVGTVYKLNYDYKPVKRVRRFFKRPQVSEENQPFKSISPDNDSNDNDSRNGIYEIAVRLGNTDNFSSAQVDTDDHPSLSSSEVSTPVPYIISDGPTAVTSPENDLPTDDIPKKITPPICTIAQNQPVLPPVIGHSTTSSFPSTTINSAADLPSTLLPPPGQPTLPSLSSVAPYFGSNYGGNKSGSGSMFSSYQL